MGGGSAREQGQDVGLFLVRAREHVLATRSQIEIFAERARALRATSAASTDGHAVHQGLLDELRRRDDELVLAIEELRSQNECLRDMHGRLERERAKYLDLYDNASEAYVTTDARGIVQDANRAAADLFAAPQSALPGKHLIGFVARKDTRAFRDHLRVICEQGGLGAFEVKLRPRGGAPFAAVLSVRAVLGLSDLPFAFRWIVQPRPRPRPRDDTERAADSTDLP
jgi:PAS domain-containing protein